MKKIKDYLLLIKPSLSIMVVFSSVMSFALTKGSDNYVNFWKMIFVLFAGGMLVTGSANAINQVVEKDTDAQMKRTAKRSVAAGRMSAQEGWAFAIITGIAGVFILGYFFNWLAAGLAAFSLFLYAFIYTPLKKVNSIAVLMGAVPGALPCLIGWAAGDNNLSTGGWILFAFQFFWQFPHFWAIAWVLNDDYKRAGFRMLPSDGGRTKNSAFQALVYTMCLIPMALVPQIFGFTGTFSTTLMILTGVFFSIPAFRLYKSCETKDAQKLMFASFIYLPVVQLIWMIDRLIS